MPAYFIVDLEVTDPAGFEEYRQLVPATIQQYGGRYVVRGGATETLEGDWQPKRVVVLEFRASNRPGAGTTPRHTAARKPCVSKQPRAR